jgi:Na+/H+ antiporter NhaD/arsenite permease-like protein
MNDVVVLAVFVTVYVAMFLGRLPRLQLDRTGAALLGAIALVAMGEVTLEQAAAAVDVPTIAILFAFMVISAQLRLGGFFGFLTRRLADLPAGPRTLLAGLIVVVGLLAAVFSNDIVCLAVAPVLVDVCRRRGLAPVPYLVALACAANIGSAVTLIGNPQNILVGEALGLDFAGYIRVAALPTLLAGLSCWSVIAFTARLEQARDRLAKPAHAADAKLDAWQSAKGLVVAIALMGIFLFTGWARDVAALGGAGVLLTSRKLHSRQMLGLVDWQLLVLFIGLFIVNNALQQTVFPERVLAALGGYGVDPGEPGWLFAITVVLSNLVSNVPAIMLLLPLAGHELGGPILALASTLAGNLLLISSIANVIVVESAARDGVCIRWGEHARLGLPIGLLSLAAAATLLLPW